MNNEHLKDSKRQHVLARRRIVKNWRLAHPDRCTILKLRWFQRHAHEMPETLRRKRCRWLTTVAIRLGILTRPPTCSKCQAEGKIQAHHSDYSQPLQVTWLCTTCHIDHHVLERIRLGIKPTHTRRHNLTQGDYDLIRQLWATGKWSQVQLGRMLGVNNSTVSKIVNRKSQPYWPDRDDLTLLMPADVAGSAPRASAESWVSAASGVLQER